MGTISKGEAISIFWFRRDLRLEDNKGLYKALTGGKPVIALFIFDTQILDKLHRDDARVGFIYNTISSIREKLAREGKLFLVRVAAPIDVFKELTDEYNIDTVYANMDHEPYGTERDKIVNDYLHEKGIRLELHLDHLLFGKNEILRDNQSLYQVFTPYSRRALDLLTDEHLKSYPSEKYISNFAAPDMGVNQLPSLMSIGFREVKVKYPPAAIDEPVIYNYHHTRDFPALKGTTRLGIHLRFGTISIRNLASIARSMNVTFFNELLWREFYAGILWHTPRVINYSYKSQYDNIEWRNNEYEFELWKQGNTGYPMVDAGMREMNATGFMHNRVRMITAGFLTKHLLIDWRWGESWFAQKLLDYELSSNNGGWQWSAGSGCDAAPYFRIFNPAEQQRKFDPQSAYIKKWIPELNTPRYPLPIVEHKAARERCLLVFKRAIT